MALRRLRSAEDDDRWYLPKLLSILTIIIINQKHPGRAGASPKAISMTMAMQYCPTEAFYWNGERRWWWRVGPLWDVDAAYKHFSIILVCVFNCALFPLYYLQNRPLPKLPIRLSCFDILYWIYATECPASDDGPGGRHADRIWTGQDDWPITAAVGVEMEMSRCGWELKGGGQNRSTMRSPLSEMQAMNDVTCNLKFN